MDAIVNYMIVIIYIYIYMATNKFHFSKKKNYKYL